MKSEQESLEFVVSFLEKYLEFDFGCIDYQMFADDLCYLSGSSLVVMNIFDESGRKSITAAVSGSPEALEKLEGVLNFQLIGKEWEVLPRKRDKLRSKGLMKYNSLHELGYGHLSHSLALQLVETLQLGTFYAVEISRGEKVLGEFTLALPEGGVLKNPLAVEMFVQQVGLVLMRSQSEKALKQSEEKYRQLFEQSPISLWEKDFSQVKKRIDEIKEQAGDVDLRSYLAARPELVKELAGLVRVLDVNQATLKLYRSTFKEEFFAGITAPFVEIFYGNFIDTLVIIAEGGQEFFAEKNHFTFDDEPLNIQLYWSVAPHCEETYSRVLVCIVDITEQKKQERMLKESEERYQVFSQLTSDYAGEYMLTENDVPILVHGFGNLQDLTGYTSEELASGGGIFSIMHSEDLPAARQKLQGLLEQRRPYIHEFRIYTKDGKLRWLRGYGLARETKEKGVRLYQVLQDITERKQAEDQVRSISDEYERVFNGTQDALFLVEVIDSDTFRYIRNNYAHEKATGFSLKKIRGKTPQELVGEKLGSQVAANYRRCLQAAAPLSYEEVLDLPVGKRIWTTTLTPVFQQGKLTYIVGSSQDITERKQAEERIRYLSFHDSLTDLYNRTFVEEEISRLDTERQLPISIIMVDLNGLKLVNDTFGHSTGDEMLKCAAEILRNSCRKEDIIARWGGDEFIIFLPQTAEEDVQIICRRIAEHCSDICIKDLPVSLALGYSIKEDAEKPLEEVLQEAEDKMYKQKFEKGRSAKNSLVNALIKTLEEKSLETEDHVQAMQEMALQMGEKLNLPASELNRLKLLIKLHDIGKINIPRGILVKEGPLTEEEWKIIKKHPEMGCRIIRSTEEFAHVSEDVLSHHERWDGTGYPQGLEGEEIPLLARITALVDACEVMRSGRPYKKALSKSEIKAEIKRCSGTQFDPQLVQTLLPIFDPENKNRKRS